MITPKKTKTDESVIPTVKSFFKTSLALNKLLGTPYMTDNQTLAKPFTANIAYKKNKKKPTILKLT